MVTQTEISGDIRLVGWVRLSGLRRCAGVLGAGFSIAAGGAGGGGGGV